MRDRDHRDCMAMAAARRAAKLPAITHAKSNEREADRQRAKWLPDTRDLTARFFGDPLPGRSALDQKKARDAR